MKTRAIDTHRQPNTTVKVPNQVNWSIVVHFLTLNFQELSNSSPSTIYIVFAMLLVLLENACGRKENTLKKYSTTDKMVIKTEL